MKTLEFQYSKWDIWHLQFDLIKKKEDRKACVKLLCIAFYLIVSFWFLFHIPIPATISPVWFVLSLFASIGILIGGAMLLVLAIMIFLTAIRWFRLTQGPFMRKHRLVFEEQWMEYTNDYGHARYFYSSIQQVFRSKRGLYIHMNYVGNTKTILYLPSSCFTDEREKERYAQFLENRQKEACENPIAEEQQLMNMAENTLLFFAFVQKEEDWVQAYVKAKAFTVRSKYWYKTVEGTASIFLLCVYLIISYALFKADVASLPIFVFLFAVIAFSNYRSNYSRKSIEKETWKLQKKGKLQPNRIGRQTVSLDQSGFNFHSDTEQFSIAYPQIWCVVETGHEVFIFTKGSLFIHIPVWVFQGKEKQEMYEILQGKGIEIKYKEI